MESIIVWCSNNLICFTIYYIYIVFYTIVTYIISFLFSKFFSICYCVFIKEDASSRKLKITTAIQGLIKKALDGDDLEKFKSTIANAKKLTEQKRYYVSNYGIENYIDIVNGKTNEIVKAPNYDRFHDNELIEWWRKLATKRFNKLHEEGRLRNDLEVWTKDSEIDIIR